MLHPHISRDGASTDVKVLRPIIHSDNVTVVSKYWNQNGTGSSPDYFGPLGEKLSGYETRDNEFPTPGVKLLGQIAHGASKEYEYHGI